MNQNLQLRLMTPADLDFADSLRALAGWNQTRNDWQRWLAHEPQGCFIAEWDGAPAGTATTTCYGTEPTIKRSRRREEADLTAVQRIRLLTSAATRTGENCELAWIGMVLVHPEYRRRGIGTALLRHCLDYLTGRGIRCIKLDATPQGRPVYERLGFQSEWPLTRWEHPGVAQNFAQPSHEPPTACSRQREEADGTCDLTGPPPYVGGYVSYELSGTGGSTDLIRSWQDADARRIDAIDRRAFGVSRQGLLQALARDSLRTLVHTSARGAIEGFGMLRQGSRASYVGPVVAASPALGTSLVQALLAYATSKPVFWDIPEPNTIAASLAEKLGFTRQRPLLRMFRGQNNNAGDPKWQFAIADPAIG